MCFVPVTGSERCCSPDPHKIIEGSTINRLHVRCDSTNHFLLAKKIPESPK